MSELIKLNNPFRKHERQIIEIRPGQTIQQIINSELGHNREIITYINGVEVTKGQRSTRILGENEFLMVAPKAGDDEVFRNILNFALMVGVFAVAGPMANFLAVNMGVASAVGYYTFYVATVVGGATLISALQPSPKKPSSGFIDDEQSQSFGWNTATIQRQGIARPRCYGLNRVYGNVIAAHTEKETRTFSETTVTEIYYQMKAGRRLPEKIYETKVRRTEFDPRKVDLNVLVYESMGPIREPVVSGSLMLNDQNAENLTSVHWEERCGDVIQQEISYFKTTKLEVVVGRLVSNGSPVTHTTTNKNFNDLEIELAFPKGLFDATGGDLANYSVNVTVEIKKSTASTWTKLADNVAITDNVGDKVIETYTTVDTFAVEYGYNYDIRVTKETADQTSIKYGDELYLDKVREIIDHAFTYPRSALVGIKAQATDQLSGSIRFSCLSRGMYVRRYSGGCGGSIGYSNNPADIIADILTQPVYTGNHSPWIDLKLLLNFEGADGATSTIDDSPKGHDITFGGGAELDTATDKFGAASLLLDGVDSYLSIAADNDSFGTWNNLVENWNIDFYVKMGDHVGTEVFAGQYADANNIWQIIHVHGSGIRFNLYISGGWVIQSTYAGEIADNDWHHIAVCKVGNEVGIYKDGTQIAYNTLSTADGYIFEDTALYIGQDGNSANYLFANIDHFRIIKSNIFSAAPNVGLTDTITEPTAPYTDPGNDYAVSRYDGYNPSKLLTADFEDLADWCDDAQVNPVNFVIDGISLATNAIVTTRSPHNFKVSDTILFRNVNDNGMTELADGITATILKVTDEYTFTIDLDTSGYTTYETAEKVIYNFEGTDGATTTNDESDFANHILAAGFIGTAQIDTAQYKFGSSSLHIPDGTSNVVVTFNNSNQLDVMANLTDSWTIEVRVKLNDHTGWDSIISNATDSNNFWQIHNGHGTGLEFENEVGGVIKILASGNEIADNDWHWIVVVKAGDDIGLYDNGSQIAYDLAIAGDLGTYGDKLFLGATYQNGGIWEAMADGWIDGIKITKSNVYNANPVIGLTDTITDPNIAPSVLNRPTIEVYQPRFAFNGIFDTETNMWDAALSVCELCRCVPFFDGDKIRLAIDKSGSSVYAFTVGNVIKDSLQIKYIPIAERASEIEVHYRDSTRNYERTPFTLINSSLSNTSAKTRLDMFGITDTDMANRLADFKLLQNQYIKQLAIWQAEVESISITIGDIVNVQNDVTNWGSIGSGDDPYTGGGRVVAATNTTNAVITIDGNIYFDDADWQGGSTTYALLIKPNTDAAPESKAITGVTESSIPHGTLDITVSGTYTVWPQRDDVWAAGVQDYETKKFRVINIRRSEEQRAEITGIEYRSECYAND